MVEHAPAILVVDNELGVTSALAIRLREHGYTPFTAPSAPLAIECMRNHAIDLIITDLSMPDIDGVTLAKCIREHYTIPIIILTGYHDDFRRTLRSVSNVTVLHKPIAMQSILDVVETELAIHARK